MAKAIKLTEIVIRQLKPKAAQYDVRDSIVPGFMVRVGANGSKTFVFRNRERGRFTIGHFPAMGLLEARDKARAWSTAKEKGIVLADVERAEKRAKEKARGELFSVTADEYIEDWVKPTRSYRKSAREIRRYLVPKLGERRVNDITRMQVVEVINAIDAPYQKRAALTHIKTFYTWAIQKGYVNGSPVHDIKPIFVIGRAKDGRSKIRPRHRRLDVRELKIFWIASERFGYPYGDLYRLLYLTGSRTSDFKQARWDQIDEEARTLTVPVAESADDPVNYKTGMEHTIQLSEWTWRIIESIKARGTHKDALFSFGEKDGYGVINSGGKPKAKLDKLIAEEWAKLKIDAPFKPFKILDLRRTLKSNLSDLRIDKEVRDAITGHAKKGIDRTYDVAKLARPVREAFTLHERWLERTVGLTPPPKDGNKVVTLKGRKAA